MRTLRQHGVTAAQLAQPLGLEIESARDGGRRRGLGYVPSLDGLRGVAIAAVMVFHSTARNGSLLPGGFIGVDVFFVLSGFLITVLLAHEFDRHGAISFRRFYMRRALRLLPALAVMLAVFNLYSLLALPREVATRNAVDSAIALFYSANWTRALGWRRPDLLGHTWSLSIEEQYYLLWPVALVLLLRAVRSRRALVAILALAAAGCWFLRVYLVAGGASIDRVYNGLDTRADALLWGSALGVAYASGLLRPMSASLRWTRWGTVIAIGSAVLGLGAIAALADWRSLALYDWVLASTALICALIIRRLVTSDSCPLKKLLELPGLVWMGGISYGLYLWHYPIFRLLQGSGYGERWVMTLGTLLTLSAASLSYYYVERPLLRLKSRYRS
jgi:peptidoglycan/LPS O-acetylase OafA/YrhL